MKQLQSIKYGANDTPLINELRHGEVELIRQRLLPLEHESRAEVFVSMCAMHFSERTFCVQTDYDHTFGNVSWQQAYLFFADAEDVIKRDLATNTAPHYLIDDSYISIYEFGELAKVGKEGRSHVDDLVRHVMALSSA